MRSLKNAAAVPLVSAVVSAVVLTGCGGASGTAGPAGDAAASEAGYGTRTVADCTGTESTFTQAPTRVATVTTSVLEFLLTLGLGDRVVGVQAVAPGAFPEDLQQAADAYPKLGGEYVPGNFVPVQREALLEAEPDLVVGGWPANFDSSAGALDQGELTERGISSYFAYAAACTRTGPVTDLSVVYDDIDNYGTIFDVEEEAADLVASMEQTVANVQERVAGSPRPTVLSYSWEDGGGEAYSVGNQALGNAIIGLAGGENIFDDVDAVYGEAGWEEVVARDPDVIVIEVFGKPTQAEFDEVVTTAEDFFTGDPALQDITAVRERRFVPVLAETYYVGGVRNAEAVETLARAFHPDAYTR